MNFKLLDKHKFQFISFLSVFFKGDGSFSRIHINDDCHLLHITRGTGFIFVENKKYSLRPGVVAAIPPFVRFYFKIKGPFEMLNIHYRLWLANGDSLDDQAGLPIIFKPSYFNTIKNILRTMQPVNRKDQPVRLLLSSWAHEIVMRHLISNPLLANDRPVVDSRLMKACRRLSAPDYSVFRAEEIARLCGLSVSQMNRLFQRCFHMSPHQFWGKRRFVELALQLRSSDNPASKIAAQFGFNDMAYFSRWFKKMAGCAPSAYRQRTI